MKPRLVHARHGKLFIDPSCRGISRSLIHTGDYQTQDIATVLKFAEKRLKSSIRESFIDIGANIGTHTVAALKTYKFQRALCVEPSTTNFALLHSNLILNQLNYRAQLANCAVGDGFSHGQLCINSINKGDHRILPVSTSFEKWSDQDLFDHSVSINIVDAGELVRKFLDGRNPWNSLIWVDCQGSEISILRSLRDILHEGCSVFFELWPYGIACQGHTVDELIDTIDWDFHQIYELKDNHLRHLDKQEVSAIWKLLQEKSAINPESYHFTNLLLMPKYNSQILQRLRMTCSCNDSDKLEKVENAGKVKDELGEKVQIMHNGLRVVQYSYYGEWMSECIKRLRGHHEPQEELVFSQIIELLPSDAFMIELGAYWSYYSLWFLFEHKNRTAVGLEPNSRHLLAGVKNRDLNNLKDQLELIHGAYSFKDKSKILQFPTETGDKEHIQMWGVEELALHMKKEYIHLLHADIQGFEEELVDEIRVLSEKKSIRFCFISTHAYEISGSYLTHQTALKKLIECGAHIIAEHDVHESFSGDGLIVASFFAEDANIKIDLSKNRYSSGIFLNPIYEAQKNKSL